MKTEILVCYIEKNMERKNEKEKDMYYFARGSFVAKLAAGCYESCFRISCSIASFILATPLNFPEATACFICAGVGGDVFFGFGSF